MASSDLPPSFSPRELAVTDLLLQGKSNKEIAQALRIASRTVEAHLGSIYAKLGVSSRTEAAIRLMEQRMRTSADAGSGNPQLPAGKSPVSLRSEDFKSAFPGRNPMKKKVIAVILLVLLCIALFLLLMFLRSR